VEADLRGVKPESFGAALHYFTGSKAHNIAIRKLGMEKGLKINEYGVFKRKGKKLKRISGRKEEDIFKAVGLPWIPPEIRHNLGEIEAAQKGELPDLITLKDIKGDLQMHSKWSDGDQSIIEMAEAAKKRGYKYIAITDHASPMGIVKGVNDKSIDKYIKAIEQADKKVKGIKILKGVEVDILPEGGLYLSDKSLKKLDVVMAAVHSSFSLPEKKMTKRIVQALQNPYVNILAHPTGRILGERAPYQLDMEEIIKTARAMGVILEINAFWSRLDLCDTHARMAKEKGVRMAINTDAHNSLQLDNMFFGVATARRGWLEKKDVVNTWPLEKLLKVLK